MGKTKDRPRYQSVSLPVPFVKEIKDHITDKPEYRSIADFVKSSVREQIKRENFEYQEELEEIIEAIVKSEMEKIKKEVKNLVKN